MSPIPGVCSRVIRAHGLFKALTCPSTGQTHKQTHIYSTGSIKHNAMKYEFGQLNVLMSHADFSLYFLLQQNELCSEHTWLPPRSVVPHVAQLSELRRGFTRRLHRVTLLITSHRKWSSVLRCDRFSLCWVLLYFRSVQQAGKLGVRAVEQNTPPSPWEQQLTNYLLHCEIS